MQGDAVHILIGLLFLFILSLFAIIAIFAYDPIRRYGFAEMQGPGMGIARAVPVFFLLLGSVLIIYVMLYFIGVSSKKFNVQVAIESGYACVEAVIEEMGDLSACKLVVKNEGGKRTQEMRNALLLVATSLLVVAILVMDVVLLGVTIMRFLQTAYEAYISRIQYYRQLYGDVTGTKPVLESMLDTFAASLYIAIVHAIFGGFIPGKRFPFYAQTFWELNTYAPTVLAKLERLVYSTSNLFSDFSFP